MEGWVRVGASGLVCGLAIKWHVKMFDWDCIGCVAAAL